jgi:hypothetical protein
MQEIHLTKGRVAIVDDWRANKLRQSKWFVTMGALRIPYAATWDGEKNALMHRLIVGAKPGETVDHINGDTLNNTEANLRLCTHPQNLWNRGKNTNNRSGHKGVTWHSRARKWMAQIGANGNHYYLGLYDDLGEAAQAYDRAARRLHGEFSRTNT